MKLSKNKKFQYIFFFLIIIYSIFNGGNSNLLIQLNFIFSSLFFFVCIKDKNYNQHLNIFIKENKVSIFIYFIFLLYLIFQIFPLPVDLLKFFSNYKFILLKKLNVDNSFNSISLSPTNSYFQFLNFFTLLIIVLIIKMIFYTERHKFRFYLFLSSLGALSSFCAVFLYLNGNPDFLFIKNSLYKDSSTGFFINRTVFSAFLLFCLIGSLQYLKMNNFVNKKNNNEIFFRKIYIRIFIIFICIGIITSFSRISNFLLIITLFYFLIENHYSTKAKNKSFRNIILLVICFDILIVGYYFGTEKIIERFLFINEQLVYDTENPHNLTRIMIINFGLENIKNFFLFGYGLGGFETLFQVNFNITDDKYANHVHSDLIQIFGELGLFGFTLLILSISKFFLYKIFYDKLNILLLFYLLIFLFFDFSLHIPLIQILFIIFFIFNKKSRTSFYGSS